jgi:hypothetical protein
MRRLLASGALLASVAVLAAAWPAGPPKTPPAKASPPAAAAKRAPGQPDRPTQRVVATLLKEVDFPEIEDPKKTLTQVLADLTKSHGVAFEINRWAFRKAGLNDVAGTEVANPNVLPALKAPLARVLEKVLERIPIPGGATFLARPGRIEITTVERLGLELWGKQYFRYRYPYPLELPRLVHFTGEEVPLLSALTSVAEQAGAGLILDPAAKGKVQMPITAQMLNASVEDAFVLLTGLADLSYVRLRSTFLVTTPQRADAVRKSHRKYEDEAAKDIKEAMKELQDRDTEDKEGIEYTLGFGTGIHATERAFPRMPRVEEKQKR